MASSYQLVATPKDALGVTVTGQQILWKTNNPRVVTVSNAGLAQAVSPGVGSVIAECQGVFGVCAITVAGLAYTPNSGSMFSTIQCINTATPGSTPNVQVGGASVDITCVVTLQRATWNGSGTPPATINATIIHEMLPPGVTVTFPTGPVLTFNGSGPNTATLHFTLTAAPKAPPQTNYNYVVVCRDTTSPNANYIVAGPFAMNVIA